MGLGGLLLTIGLGIQPTEFLIDTDTPDALCPELSMTRDAVRRRLGQLEGERGETWHGRYSNVHDPSGRRGDYVRLVIFDPKGNEQTSRDLPLQGESCATMAQAIALVVDGFFRDLGQTTPRESTLDVSEHSAAIPEERDQTQQPASSSDPAPATVAPTSIAPRSHFRTGPMLGVAYESVAASAAASLGWFAAGTAPLRIEMRVSLPTSQVHQSRSGVVASAYLIPLRLSLDYSPLLLRRLQPFIGPEFLLSVERGSAVNVAGGRAGWRATEGLGIHWGLAYWLTGSMAIAAGVSADYALLQSRRFLIDEEPVLEWRRARVAGAVELRGAIFP